jgi:hypothetical protein
MQAGTRERRRHAGVSRMMVYGDRRRQVAVRRALAALATGPPGEWDRLIAAGELACGILDARLAARGVDHADETAAACHALVVAAARGGELAPALARLDRLALPASVEVSAALEGFAHYALTPDQYARSARAAARCAPAARWLVIGIRSIGLPLGAVVARELAAELVSVRPTGHPFRREVRASPRLRERIAGDRHCAVVDEGPGLSGSSFAAVCSWLAEIGIAQDRIVVLPGHAGDPGPEADARIRRLWSAVRRFPAEPDHGFLTGGAERVVDLGAGAWRRELALVDWPPCDARRERHKILVVRGGQARVWRFAGLGESGRVKAARASALAARGLHLPVRDLRGGYLALDWLPDARPADRVPRGELLDHLARYLAARAQLPPSRPGRGADPAGLLAMAEHNLAGALAADLARARAALPAATLAHRPVATDGRLHRWEWLATPDGRLHKTDALDHALAHDLIGEQDLEWDLAGAELELALTPAELDALRTRLDRRTVPLVADFYRLTYAAFHFALFSTAADLAPDPAEKARLAAERDRYLAAARAIAAAPTR